MLDNGYYRYVRTTQGEIFWSPPGSMSMHIELEREADSRVISAGFFEVQNNVVTLPQEVETIDSENKTNRSISLGLEPRRIAGSVPDDLTLILQVLEI